MTRSIACGWPLVDRGRRASPPCPRGVGCIRRRRLRWSRHLRHLQRRHRQPLLADGSAGDVDWCVRARAAGRCGRGRTARPRRRAGRSCGSVKNPNSLIVFSAWSAPSFWPTWANTVLTDWVSAVLRSIGRSSRVPALQSGWNSSVMQARAVDQRVMGRVQLAFERRRGGHGLERRSRRVQALGGAVQERCAAVGRISGRSSVTTRVGVEGRRGVHRDHPAGARLDRDHRADAAGRRPCSAARWAGTDRLVITLSPVMVSPAGVARFEMRWRGSSWTRSGSRCRRARDRCVPGRRCCSPSHGRTARP